MRTGNSRDLPLQLEHPNLCSCRQLTVIPQIHLRFLFVKPVAASNSHTACRVSVDSSYKEREGVKGGEKGYVEVAPAQIVYLDGRCGNGSVAEHEFVIMSVRLAPGIVLGAETENCSLQPYPKKVSTTSLDNIALYIRSSGSTGLPRAVGETHQMLKQWIILSPVADVRAEAEHWEPLGAMAVPPFHIFGIWEQLVQPPAGTCVAVYPPAGALPGALPITPSADNILEHVRMTKCLVARYGARYVDHLVRIFRCCKIPQDPGSDRASHISSF
ncbi:hypothetical protein DFH08DRAFT_999625 [Mycena albidolilacea]|uniref:AMP-dependent synthetase/ligase domain-containing protein n=1 Tax=Mycena albidolilacea TaxID=1033008 RepID=A0AAD7E708_9AGAR|nr:hypothetical protein DFH08DRAFT_999625 [Mycena albidolilacea]